MLINDSGVISHLFTRSHRSWYVFLRVRSSSNEFLVGTAIP